MSGVVEIPETRYTRSGDVTIAYQVVGEGPPDIVFVPGFVSHLELNWESGFYGDSLARFVRMGRLITFDKRGTGLSDRTRGVGSLEERMDDIRAVMDAAGSERAFVGGVSEGGPLCAMLAATYPERVEKLTLYATFARLLRAPGYDEGGDPAVFEPFCQFLESAWGTGDALAPFVQYQPPGDVARRLLARIERYSATPEIAASILRQVADIDVRPLLPSINVPTFVVHTTGDPMVPVSCGRYLAAHIPNAEYHEIDDAYHVSWERSRHEVLMDRIEEFMFGRVVSTVVSERVLTTLLFTDIVDSTRRATAMGDAAWRALLDEHDASVRGELARHRGHEVNTTGDGFVAMFDGPARAVRCAQAIIARAHALGLEIRAGVHTGECEVRGDDVAGIAVHIAARVMAGADDGGVLVTRTVRDLVAGSGITFEARGAREFKGVTEPIEVFAAVG